ncbi:DUF1318 domain-containing protein [Geomobilimonas luticola]|uniref:DUF1318 domain-containing protein n=1 Tax=Geomobilimonas luticola TaxID=1114878 RepID=A0ABS5SDZ6_9BACT|nr:DUF1318 domain-containing protein [Geomobilimonas luticola]MBT0653580.1 DUF1318 domain-containing protein [Geomobilimonas luticola]
MNMRILKWLLAGGCGLLTACAIITVNVYFPEKAVKEAYKSLDEMLLKKSGEKGAEEKPAGGQTPAEEQKAPETKPQSRLFDELPSLSLVPAAHAADNVADDLAIELSGNAEVLKAYEEMSQRLPNLKSLYDAGVVGLTNQGLVTVRDKTKVTPEDDALVKAENASRKTVVINMAKAILKINKQQESKAALAQVQGKAAATYAETKREEAKPGWWMQLPNGRWVQK